GRIPKRSQHPELGTVPLGLREKASPFWIILLLVEGDPEHPRTKLAAPGSPQKTLTNVRYWGQSGHRLVRCTCLLLTQSGHYELKYS
ncbi:MAG: hypothetical protein WBZ08_12975, partial [Pseudolabrys sp.]